jgi:hypothetical protein
MSKYEQNQYELEHKMHQNLYKEILNKRDERNILDLDLYVIKIDLDQAYNDITTASTVTDISTCCDKIKKEFNNLCYKYINLRDLLLEEIKIVNSLDDILENDIFHVQKTFDLNKKKKSESIMKINREYMSKSDISLMERLAIMQCESDLFSKEQEKRELYLCNLSTKINFAKNYKSSLISLSEENKADIIKEHERIVLFKKQYEVN